MSRTTTAPLTTRRPAIARRRRSVTTLAATLVAVLVLAAPAAAHPFFRGGEAPVDSLATLTLDLAHGCASETAGEGDPTDEVALEVPEWMRVVAVDEPAGWTVDFELDEAGFAEVVVWLDAGGAEPAPAFELDVVVEGEPGTERFVSVFQACDDFQYRWIGTPEQPADDPAIRLRLIDADPDSPAPAPEPIVAPEEPDTADEPANATDDTDTDAGDASAGTDESVAGEEEPTPEAEPDDAIADEFDEETDEALDPLAVASDDAGGGFPWWLVVVIGVVAIVAITLIGQSRRSAAASGDGR